MSNENYFQLHQGDTFHKLVELPDESIDFVFADPPYHLSNGGFSVSSGHAVSVDKGEWDKSAGLDADFDFHHRWLTEVRRVLKKDGSIVVSGTYHSIYRCGFAAEQAGYRILNEIVWYKPNAAPNLAGRNLAASHETLIWASREKSSKHVFNYSAMKEFEDSKDFIKKPGKQMRDVWAISTTRPSEKVHGKHPTQKPLALLERIILAFTHPGSVVLDPFAGSSTTGVAALMHGRNYIGIEREVEYIDLSRKRLLEVMGETA